MNTTEILIGVFSLIGIIISALLSFYIAKYQAKNEIKKVMLSFEQEKQKIFIDEFASLFALLNCNTIPYKTSVEKCLRLINICPNHLAKPLLDLHNAIVEHNDADIFVIKNAILADIAINKENNH